MRTRRACELQQDAIVVDFELLPEMTFEPCWGGMITEILRKELDSASSSRGLRSLLRVTPVDIRETTRPPLKRRGADYEDVLESFRVCARAGADLFSIESVGGKEVTDKAIMESDIRGIVFGAGILVTADVRFLWERICSIARETETIAAGDTACGIGNTAMVLADRLYVPRVFAAVVRVITAVRSLAGYEAGAVGPGKDCGYENIFNRTALEEITAMAEIGQFNWKIVKALVALNRASKPHFDECVISFEKRGTPPPHNKYGIIAKG